MKQLLIFPDKHILEALIDGPNFEHFLKIFQSIWFANLGKISLNLFQVYK